jgi:hypothetical protein
MIATKALREAGIAARMLPILPNLKSAANLCLSIDAGAEPSAMAAISSAKLALGGVVR